MHIPKKIHRRRVIELFAASSALAAAPGRASENQNLHHWSGVSMGAGADLTIRHQDRSEAERLLKMARQEISRLEAMFSLYQTDSALSRLNKTGRLSKPPAEFLELLSICATLYGATGGAFDPAVQSLWTYHAEMLSGVREPDAALFQEILAGSGWPQIEYDTGEVRLRSMAAALTFNGIAQGFVTDKVASLLRANGLQNILVSVGEIAAFGERAPGAPWRVGLRHFPGDDASEEIEIKNGAIATTAPLATTLDQEGRLSHILDPKTGRPAQSPWRQISVMCSSAAFADGLSTGMALMDRKAVAHVASSIRNVRIIAFNGQGSRITY